MEKNKSEEKIRIILIMCLLAIFCEIKKIINMLSRSKRFGLEFLQQ